MMLGRMGLMGLMAAVLLAGGCGGKQFGFLEVAPGADPVVVYAEWTAENGANALDQFLQWERDNETELLKRNPAIHATADAVRVSAPNQLRELRRVTRQYQADKTGEHGSQVRAATVAVLAIVNAVRVQMGRPPIQPPPEPKLMNVGGGLP